MTKYGDKIADATDIELLLDIDYNGREDWPEDISHEHRRAHTMQNDLISMREVKSIIRNELLNNLGKTTGNQLYFDDSKGDNTVSPSTQQGSEYVDKKNDRKCGPAAMDMNQYIRKDSIPCWGCDIE